MGKLRRIKTAHLGFYSATQAVYVTSQNVKLYNFNKLNGFSYVGETTQNTACPSCPGDLRSRR